MTRHVFRRSGWTAPLSTAVAVALAAACDGSTAACNSPDGGRPSPATTSSTDGGICHPTSAASYVPHWVPPIKPRPDVCTEGQIQQHYDDCYGTMATSEACDAFDRDPKNATCLSCLMSPANADSYGAAVIQTDHSVYPNYPGCVALLEGDASDTGCGAKLAAARYCPEAVCIACVTTQAKHSACFAEAYTLTECAAFSAADVCATDPKYAVCLAYPSFAEGLIAMGKLFCVTGLQTNATEGGVRDSGTRPVLDAGATD